MYVLITKKVPNTSLPTKNMVPGLKSIPEEIKGTEYLTTKEMMNHARSSLDSTNLHNGTPEAFLCSMYPMKGKRK